MAKGDNTECLNMRVNKALKEEFDKFCNKKGLSASKAVKLYANRCIRDGAIPYRFGRAGMESGVNDVRVSFRMDGETRQAFADACGKYDMPMSLFVRDFMKECIASGDFPFEIGAN